MFFIKIRGKVFHIIGIILAVLMFTVSVALVVFSAFFNNGSGETGSAELFGYNLYVVKNSTFEIIPKNSIAVAQKVSASSLSPEYLIVYNEFNSENRALGKVNEVFISDGVYSCDVTDENGNTVTVSEGQLIGEVVYYSQLLGDIINFARSPMGILVIAIMPCLAIILLDLIKVIISRLPPPEVIPVKKNEEAAQTVQSSNTIKVGDDGNASYSSAKKALAPESVQDVLFTRNKVYSYQSENRGIHTKSADNNPIKPTAPQNAVPKPSEREQQLVRNAPKAVQNAYRKAAETALTTPIVGDKAVTSQASEQRTAELRAPELRTPEQRAPELRTPELRTPELRTPELRTPELRTPEQQKTPASAVKPQDGTKHSGFFTSRKTAEPPVLKNPAEPKAKKEVKPIEKARNLADLEESLIYTHTKSKTEPKVHSSDVIAGIKPDSLLRDDDDAMDKKRYSVDDILAGLDKK